MVRVAGFSSYFTRLYKGVQDSYPDGGEPPDCRRPLPNCSTRMKCMLEITIAPEVIAKFKELLVEEDNEDAVFRIRETKVGGG